MKVDSKSGHFCSDLQHHRGAWGQDVLYRGALNNLCVRSRSENVSRGWTWNVRRDKVVTFLSSVYLTISTYTWISVRVMCLWGLWTAITGPFWPQMTLDQAHVSAWVSHYLRPCLDQGWKSCWRAWMGLAAVRASLAGSCNWSFSWILTAPGHLGAVIASAVEKMLARIERSVTWASKIDCPCLLISSDCDLSKF